MNSCRVFVYIHGIVRNCILGRYDLSCPSLARTKRRCKPRSAIGRAVSENHHRRQLFDDYHHRRRYRHRRHLRNRRRRSCCHPNLRRLLELIILQTKRTEQIESRTFPCLNQTGEGSCFRFLCPPREGQTHGRVGFRSHCGSSQRLVPPAGPGLAHALRGGEAQGQGCSQPLRLTTRTGSCRLPRSSAPSISRPW